MPDTPNAPDRALLARSDHAGVATLTLNRPQQFNALSSALLIELQTALGAVARDASVRVVVIAAGKQAFYEQLDAGLEQAYDICSKSMHRNMMLADAAEGIDAFIEKRKPAWKAR